MDYNNDDQSNVIMTFPEEEHESIKGYLRSERGYCYTTRVYKEMGKYIVGRKPLVSKINFLPTIQTPNLRVTHV